jgi:type III secretion protein R
MADTNVDVVTFFSSSGFSALSLIILFFFILSLSSYIKIVTVLGIIRVGIGVGSLPSVFVTGVLSIALSFFVMYPTLQGSAKAYNQIIADSANVDSNELRVAALMESLEVWKDFLAKHSHRTEKDRFISIAHELDNNIDEQIDISTSYDENSLRILAPAFVISELKEAFATGLSLFLPFLVIDLVIANLLVAVGLTRLDPTYVAFPFKLLLFVLVDGWVLITSNLVLSYAG